MIDTLLSDRLYNPQLINPFNAYNFSQYGSRLYSVLFVLFFVICVVAFMLMFIWGGLKWVTSGGGKEKVESARSTISNALTGLLILLILWVIIQLINTVFGIDVADIGDIRIGSPTSTPIPTPTGIPTPTAAPIGGNCTSNSQCASGFCGSTIDADADTFHPAYISGTGICISAIDCNDSNALVFPGQTTYFQTGVGGSLTNFDYDCNGTNDRWPTLNCLSTGITACSLTPLNDSVVSSGTGWVSTIPQCGTTIIGNAQIFNSCNSYTNTGCDSTPATNSPEEGCFANCTTGNLCGYDENEPCLSWSIQSWAAFTYFNAPLGSIDRMPCK